MSTAEARALPVVDAIERDGEELVLIGDRVVLVSPLGRLIRAAVAEGWVRVDALVPALVRELGAPVAVDPDEVVAAAVAELATAGLVEVR
ncbi:hypothetical protein ACDF64_10210 [Agromyces sp. MMS24-JH15]|uniref:hypothetical protein n=1 Tax=Agromyces sp. MMS24-JH15 TaxID=3243765 RepID=UPI0037486AFC